MGIELTNEEFGWLVTVSDKLSRLLGIAQGRADSYAARREDVILLQFPQKTDTKEVKETKQKENTEVRTFFKKYNKEFLKMSKNLQEKIMRAVQRKARFHNGAYEKRALINGIELYSCSSKIDECEANFLREVAVKIMSVNPDQTEPPARKKSPSILFSDWADEWMLNVYKPSVTVTTFTNDYYRYKNHIKPFFGSMRLKDVLPIDCIKFCNGFLDKNEARTAEACYGLVKRILQFAVESDLITKNPMNAVKPIKAERTNGVPISPEEERKLLSAIKGTSCEAVIALALYTGLRPCEYSTARIEGEFIVAQNRKQRNVKKVVYKKIPITPMLAPFVPLLKKQLQDWDNAIKGAQKAFKNALPNHKPYDMRTTFATRSQECGVPENVVQVWLGHKPRTLLGNTYTKFSDDYLLSEGKKVKY